MKYILLSCIAALACVLGYLSESSIRPILLGDPNAKKSGETAGQSEMVLGDEPSIDFFAFTPEQLPKTIKINKTVQFTDKDSGLLITMKEGNSVNLIRIESRGAVVSPLNTNFKRVIPIHFTDLEEQMRGVSPQTPSAAPQVANNPAATIDTPPQAPASPTPPTPAASPTSPDDELFDEPVANASPTTAPVSTTAPVPATAAVPTPEAVPATAPVASSTYAPVFIPRPITTGEMSKSNVVAIMKNSLMNKQIQEIRFEQVTDWQPGPVEIIDGQPYDTGTIIYSTEFFGTKRDIQAKAVIQNGRVIRWLWAKSGLELN